MLRFISSTAIGAGPAQVADGFIGRLRHIDGRQFASAQETGQFCGIAFIGFNPVTETRRDERRGDDLAGDLELLQAPCDAKSAGTGLEHRARMGLADFGSVLRRSRW
ncbi:MAG TPA: hypothetical protein VIT91_10765 [Chthoniobacterales bacterium]